MIHRHWFPEEYWVTPFTCLFESLKGIKWLWGSQNELISNKQMGEVATKYYIDFILLFLTLLYITCCVQPPKLFAQVSKNPILLTLSSR